MHLVRRHEADAGVMLVLVVPVEERTTEAPGVLDAAEALRKVRLILQGFEVALGERVVVGGVGTVVRAGNAKVGQQQAVALAFIGAPRSACSVSWPGETLCLATVHRTAGGTG